MQVPTSVLQAVELLPDRRAGTIVLHFGPQVPHWIVEYEVLAEFETAECALRHIQEVSEKYANVKPAFSRRAMGYRVTYLLRQAVDG